MYEDEQIAEEEITADELTDLAFGMFTIFSEQRLEAEGSRLFEIVESGEDILDKITELFAEFSDTYPLLAEPLSMFGSPADVLSFYRFGEAILPTKTTHSYWIQQSRPGTPADACGDEQAGKWLIFLPSADIDEAWIKVRNATVAGELGIGAKVSTFRDNEDSRDDKKVIYAVFTVCLCFHVP